MGGGLWLELRGGLRGSFRRWGVELSYLILGVELWCEKRQMRKELSVWISLHLIVVITP